MADRTKTIWAIHSVVLGYALYSYLGADAIVQLAGLVVAMLLIVSLVVGMLSAALEAADALRGLLATPRVRYGELAAGEVPIWFVERL